MKESVGILIISRKTNRFLLLHRVNKPLVWSLLSGKMDVKGETPLQTIKREIKEEINLDPSRIKNIKKIGELKDNNLFHLFVGFVDLRMLRLFRLFQISRASKFLVPTNTLIKTIVMQRNALLGSQMMVISILLIVSTLIYFLESEAQPEIFGSIPAAMWWGIATLTTVGYGDVVPSTEVGKILASFTMFIGIGMFALPAAILASAYYEEIQKRNFLITFEAIAAIPLFQQLPVGAINKINEKLDVKLFQKNEEIFKKGEEGDAMFIIEQGQVKVDLENPVYLGPGDFFGEMALISNSPRNATLVATDDSKLFELKKSDLEELFDEHEVLFRELEETIKNRSA